MRYIALIIFCLTITQGKSIQAQEVPHESSDYTAIGLTFEVPSDWTHDGLNTTTKAAFIKQFGWIYDKPDASDLWSAVGRFSSMVIDSTLVPSDSAYTIHNLTIFVNRANTLYKRWLCRLRRSSVWELKPLIKENHILTLENRIDPHDLPAGLQDAFGKRYEYYSDHISLPTTGHVFNFVHQKKCYEIKLESTTTDILGSILIHNQILDSIERLPF